MAISFWRHVWRCLFSLRGLEKQWKQRPSFGESKIDRTLEGGHPCITDPDELASTEKLPFCTPDNASVSKFGSSPFLGRESMSGEPYQFSGCVQHYSFHTPNQCPYPLKIQTGHQVDSSKHIENRKKTTLKLATKASSPVEACQIIPSHRATQWSFCYLTGQHPKPWSSLWMLERSMLGFDQIFLVEHLPSPASRKKTAKTTAKVNISEPQCHLIHRHHYFWDRSKKTKTPPPRINLDPGIFTPLRHSLHNKQERKRPATWTGWILIG